MKTLHLYALLGLLACTTAALGAETISYQVTDLGTAHFVSGAQSKVIDDNGDVAGNTGDVSGHAALYTGGSWVDLGALNTSGSGSAGSFSNGLNNTAVVVGESNTGNGDQLDAFFVPASGSITALGLAGSGNPNQDAIAYAVSNNGSIVGSLVDNTLMTSTPFVYQIGSGLVKLAHLADYKFAINNYGDLLGETFGATANTVALNGTALPASVAGFSPHAINNSGQILLSVDADSAIDGAWGVLYNYVTGQIVKIGNLSPKSAGYTTYVGLNDFGEVVGRGVDDAFAPHAVYYSEATGMVSLDGMNFTLGGVALHLIDAQGINNAGQIVCTGFLDTDDSSLTRVVLLTPTTADPSEKIAATYDGTASVSGFQTGTISLTVATNNSFTAKLEAPGVSYTFKGALTGTSFNGMVTAGASSLSVALQVSSVQRSISGTVSNGSVTYTFSAVRQARVGAAAGKYTALIRSVGTPPTGLPGGIGFAVMTVSSAGVVSITGEFGDATKFTRASQVHTDGTFTFYAPLYTKEQPGGIAGILAFNRAAPNTDCSGELDWSIPGASFTGSVQFQAARYTPPKGQALQFTNSTDGTASFTLTSGDFSTISHTLAVTNKNAVSVTDSGTDKLVVELNAAAGLLSGSFFAPGAAKATTFSGVIQQKLNLAGGVFLGPTQAGAALLTPQ